MAQALDGFDAFVESALKDWKVPGVAVAILKDGGVVLAKGYGLRDVKRHLPVTPETLFAIGSATKAFTVMSPSASSSTTARSRGTRRSRRTCRPSSSRIHSRPIRMTPKDLVTHRSGLPRHDLVWYNAPLSRKEIFDRLQYLEPNVDFRYKFQYQNLMFLTAGYLAGEVSGLEWEELVRRRIFHPLGMKSSNFSVEASRATADFALPYNEKDKAIQEIAFRNIDVVGPAGSINSNLNDMAQWVKLHLSDGKVLETRVISEAGLDEMHRPQMVMRDDGQDPEIVLGSYGLGWFIESYRGKRRVHHGGNIDGFSAMVTFLPDQDISVVALANKNGTPLPEILCRVAIDRLLGLEPIDWNARIKARADEGEKAADKAKGTLEVFDRKKGTRPSHPLRGIRRGLRASGLRHADGLARRRGEPQGDDPRDPDEARSLALRHLPGQPREPGPGRGEALRPLPHQHEGGRGQPDDAPRTPDRGDRVHEEAPGAALGSGIPEDSRGRLRARRPTLRDGLGRRDRATS